jgi:6-phosphofructokinase 1
MATVEAIAPEEFEMRSVVLGHTQRGGSPNADDRILARAYGVAAIEAVERGDFGHMVSFRKGVMTTIPIVQAVGELHRVTAEDPVYKAARKIGIYLGGN